MVRVHKPALRRGVDRLDPRADVHKCGGAEPIRVIVSTPAPPLYKALLFRLDFENPRTRAAAAAAAAAAGPPHCSPRVAMVIHLTSSQISRLGYHGPLSVADT
jgi:hypothetical protein